MTENSNFNTIASKLDSTFWDRYAPIRDQIEDYNEVVDKFSLNKLYSIFSVSNKEELINLIRTSSGISNLMLFLINYTSGVSEYYNLSGSRRAKLSEGLEKIFKEEPSMFDLKNRNNPILKSMLLEIASNHQFYNYNIETSNEQFHETVRKQLEKGHRLITLIHSNLGKGYNVEHILGDKDRIIIYIVREKRKKIILRRNKTVFNPDTSERIILVDWKRKILRIPKYDRREIRLFLNFFKFKNKIGIKDFEYADIINPTIPEQSLDYIKEIRTQPLEELNASLHLRSYTVDPIKLDDKLRGIIKNLKYSQIKQLTVSKDGKRSSLRVISANDFFFRPNIMGRDQGSTSFGLELGKKYLAMDPANLKNEIIKMSLDRLEVRDYQHPKIKEAIDQLEQYGLVDFTPDEKRVCNNKDCEFRREISYFYNRKYKYRCPKCRDITVFKEDVLTLIPNLNRIMGFTRDKILDLKNNNINLDIAEHKFYTKIGKKITARKYIELSHRTEKEKLLNIFFADRQMLNKVRTIARSQIIPYIIILVGPISAKDQREIKLSNIYISLIEGKGKLIKETFDILQEYGKWREEIVEEAINVIKKPRTWGEFEDAVFICFQYLFPSSIKLGKKFAGSAYPDGFGRLIISQRSMLFGWDAKFSKRRYNFREAISKHYKYLDYLKRKGGLKHYLIVGNNLSKRQFEKVFLNRRKFKNTKVSFITSNILRQFVSLIRREDYNILDFDCRSKCLNVMFNKLNGRTNYFNDFSLLKDEIKQVIAEQKRTLGSIQA